MKKQDLQVIGATEYVVINDQYFDIPAKIDTGADSSAIWASNITLNQSGALEFCLFGPKSKFYTGERLTAKDYRAVMVKSSNGEKEVRYSTKLTLKMKDRTIKTTFTLANRERNHFPVLIGRRTIKNKFIVDVSESAITRRPIVTSHKLNSELSKDPHKFHQKYQPGKEN